MNARTVRGGALSLLLASFVLTGSPAGADLGPPTRCPDGLQSSYLEGRYCAPIECTADDACGDEKCVERAVCLRPRNHSTEPGAEKYFEYVGECGTSPTCADGTCLTKKVCTTPGGGVTPVDGPAGSKRGCGACSVPGGRTGATVALLALVAGAGLLLGRRRARPR